MKIGSKNQQYLNSFKSMVAILCGNGRGFYAWLLSSATFDSRQWKNKESVENIGLLSVTGEI